MIATVNADATPPRVTISEVIYDQPVSRVVDGVETPVRGLPTGGVIVDYECPQEVPVTYSAWVPILPGGMGGVVAVTNVVELPNVGDWLVHLGQPEALSVSIDFESHDEWSTPANMSVADIPGGPTIVVSMARPAARGSFAVNTYHRDEEDALRALLADGSPLFLSTHSEVGFGPCYLGIGDVSWARFVNYSGDQSRVVSLAYVEISRPLFITTTGGTIGSLPGTIGSLPGTIESLGT